MPVATIQPLAEAVEMFDRKSPVGSTLASREWEAVPAEIRLRAMFSARVESERLLVEAQQRLQSRLELAKKDGRTMDRGVFIEEMRQELAREGYKRGDAKRGSLQDLKSTRRLGLIWDMNIAQAQGYARWKMGMDPDMLDAAPAQELIRVQARVEVREWPLLWQEHGGQFYGEPGPDYPGAPGRMIALKTDPIWMQISRFKTPWPPFDWGSGMGLRNIRRKEAEALGLIRRGQRLTPQSVPFNRNARMSVVTLPESSREKLRSTFGDAIRFDGDDVMMHRESSPETHEQRQLDITTSLRERARGQFLQANRRFQRLRGGLREEDSGAQVDRGAAEERGSIYIAQASAVSVGRKQLFHDTMSQEEAEAFLSAIADFPDQVAAHYDPTSTHMVVWRRDLLPLSADSLIRMMDRGEGGMLLGYGRDSMAFAEPHVLVRIYQAPRGSHSLPLGGFHAPIEKWRAFADARAKDFADAMGIETDVEWEVRP